MYKEFLFSYFLLLSSAPFSKKKKKKKVVLINPNFFAPFVVNDLLKRYFGLS